VEFKDLYPFLADERVTIAKEYVVKKLERIELNVYNLIDHPCILKPLCLDI
jgi:hypothetical protein